jgi:hypothetical protein
MASVDVEVCSLDYRDGPMQADAKGRMHDSVRGHRDGAQWMLGSEAVCVCDGHGVDWSKRQWHSATPFRAIREYMCLII